MQPNDVRTGTGKYETQKGIFTVENKKDSKKLKVIWCVSDNSNTKIVDEIKLKKGNGKVDFSKFGGDLDELAKMIYELFAKEIEAKQGTNDAKLGRYKARGNEGSASYKGSTSQEKLSLNSAAKQINCIYKFVTENIPHSSSESLENHTVSDNYSSPVSSAVESAVGRTPFTLGEQQSSAKAKREYHDKLKQLAYEIDQLKQQLDVDSGQMVGYSDEISELRRKNIELENALQNLAQVNEKLESQAENLCKENQEFKSLNDTHEERIRKLNSQLDELTKKNAEIQGELKRHLDSVEAAKIELQNAQEKNEEAKRVFNEELQKLNNENLAFVKTSSQQVEKLQGEYDTAKRELEQAQRSFDEKTKALQEELVKAKAEIEEKENTLKILNDIQAKFEAQKEEYDSIQQQHVSTNQKLEELRLQLANTEQSAREQEKLLREYQLKESSLNEELQKAKSNLKTVCSEKEDLQEKVGDQQQELEKLQKLKIELSSTNDNQATRFQQLESDTILLRDQLSETDERLAAATQKVATYSENVAALEQEKESLQKEVKEVNANFEQYLARLNEIIRHYGKVQADERLKGALPNVSTVGIEELGTLIRENVEIKKELNRRLDEAQLELTSQQDVNATNLNKLESLQQNLLKAEEEKEVVNSKLKELQATFEKAQHDRDDACRQMQARAADMAALTLACSHTFNIVKGLDELYQAEEVPEGQLDEIQKFRDDLTALIENVIKIDVSSEESQGKIEELALKLTNTVGEFSLPKVPYQREHDDYFARARGYLASLATLTSAHNSEKPVSEWFKDIADQESKISTIHPNLVALETMRHTNQELQTKLNDMVERSELEEAKNQLLKALEEKEQQNKQAQEELQALQFELKTLEARNQKFEESLNTKTSEVQRVNNLIQKFASQRKTEQDESGQVTISDEDAKGAVYGKGAPAEPENIEATLKRILENLSSELEELKREKELQKTLTQANVVEISAKLAILQKNNEILQSTNEELRNKASEVDGLQKDIQRLNKKILKSQENLHLQEIENKRKDQELRSLIGQLEEAKSAEDEAKSELSEIRDHLGVAEGEPIINAAKAIQAAVISAKSAEKEREDVTSKFMRLQDEFENAQILLNSTNEKLEEARCQVEEKTATLKKNAEELKKNAKKIELLDQYKASVCELEKILSGGAGHQISDSTNFREKLYKKIEELNQVSELLTKSQEKVGHFEKGQENLIKALEKPLQGYNFSNQDIQEIQAKLKETVEQTVANLQKAQTETDNLKKQLEDSTSNLSTAENSLRKAGQELATLTTTSQKELEQANELLKKANEINKGLEGRVKELETQKETLDVKVMHLTRETENKDEENKKLHKTAEKLQKTVDVMNKAKEAEAARICLEDIEKLTIAPSLKKEFTDKDIPEPIARGALWAFNLSQETPGLEEIVKKIEDLLSKAIEKKDFDRDVVCRMIAFVATYNKAKSSDLVLKRAKERLIEWESEKLEPSAAKLAAFASLTEKPGYIPRDMLCKVKLQRALNLFRTSGGYDFKKINTLLDLTSEHSDSEAVEKFLSKEKEISSISGGLEDALVALVPKFKEMRKEMNDKTSNVSYLLLDEERPLTHWQIATYKTIATNLLKLNCGSESKATSDETASGVFQSIKEQINNQMRDCEDNFLALSYSPLQNEETLNDTYIKQAFSEKFKDSLQNLNELLKKTSIDPSASRKKIHNHVQSMFSSAFKTLGFFADANAFVEYVCQHKKMPPILEKLFGQNEASLKLAQLSYLYVATDPEKFNPNFPTVAALDDIKWIYEGGKSNIEQAERIFGFIAALRNDPVLRGSPLNAEQLRWGQTVRDLLAGTQAGDVFAAGGSGKTVTIKFFMRMLKEQYPRKKVIFLTPIAPSASEFFGMEKFIHAAHLKQVEGSMLLNLPIGWDPKDVVVIVDEAHLLSATFRLHITAQDKASKEVDQFMRITATPITEGFGVEKSLVAAQSILREHIENLQAQTAYLQKLRDEAYEDINNSYALMIFEAILTVIRNRQEENANKYKHQLPPRRASITEVFPNEFRFIGPKAEAYKKGLVELNESWLRYEKEKSSKNKSELIKKLTEKSFRSVYKNAQFENEFKLHLGKVFNDIDPKAFNAFEDALAAIKEIFSGDNGLGIRAAKEHVWKYLGKTYEMPKNREHIIPEGAKNTEGSSIKKAIANNCRSSFNGLINKKPSNIDIQLIEQNLADLQTLTNALRTKESQLKQQADLAISSQRGRLYEETKAYRYQVLGPLPPEIKASVLESLEPPRKVELPPVKEMQLISCDQEIGIMQEDFSEKMKSLLGNVPESNRSQLIFPLLSFDRDKIGQIAEAIAHKYPDQTIAIVYHNSFEDNLEKRDKLLIVNSSSKERREEDFLAQDFRWNDKKVFMLYDRSDKQGGDFSTLSQAKPDSDIALAVFANICEGSKPDKDNYKQLTESDVYQSICRRRGYRNGFEPRVFAATNRNELRRSLYVRQKAYEDMWRQREIIENIALQTFNAYTAIEKVNTTMDKEMIGKLGDHSTQLKSALRSNTEIGEALGNLASQVAATQQVFDEVLRGLRTYEMGDISLTPRTTTPRTTTPRTTSIALQKISENSLFKRVRVLDGKEGDAEMFETAYSLLASTHAALERVLEIYRQNKEVLDKEIIEKAEKAMGEQAAKVANWRTQLALNPTRPSVPIESKVGPLLASTTTPRTPRKVPTKSTNSPRALPSKPNATSPRYPFKGS